MYILLFLHFLLIQKMVCFLQTSKKLASNLFNLSPSIRNLRPSRNLPKQLRERSHWLVFIGSWHRFWKDSWMWRSSYSRRTKLESYYTFNRIIFTEKLSKCSSPQCNNIFILFLCHRHLGRLRLYQSPIWLSPWT